MQNKLYEFTVKISRGAGCDLPENMDSAYVNCYSSDQDHESAVRKGVIAIKQDSYIFEDVVKGIREIPVDNWDEYIKQTWPEFIEYLPKYEDVQHCVKEGMVFFSPFMGFKE